MLKNSIILFFLLSGLLGSSQENQQTFKIKFTDKANSDYNIENPETFLSRKALERRAKMGIDIKEDDLPVSTAYIEVLKEMGGRIIVNSRWLNTVVVEFDEGTGLDDLRSLKFIERVEDAAYLTARQKAGEEFISIEKPFFINESYSMLAASTVNKSVDESQAFNYGDSYNQINMLNGIALHNDGYTGEGMTIAVLDAGFEHVDTYPAFDTLWLNNRIIDTRNIVQPGQSVFDPGPNRTHGMMVLSTMGGNLPGQLVGTAPDADYYLIRTEDADAEYLMEEYFWVMGAEYADSIGADIINSSLGYTEFDNPEENHTYEDLDGDTTPITIGADKAAQKGILVCNSAGNYADDPWLYIGAPADADSILTVGAVKADGTWANFSSIGPTYDGRIKPTVVAQGQAAIVAAPWGGIWAGDGTSFSSPIMAGMAACLWQANPGYINMELIEALVQSASQYDSPDEYLGYGIPDFVVAGDIMGTTEIGYHMVMDNILISPNPFNDWFQLRFELEKSSNIQLNIHDLAGRIVYSENFNGNKGNNLLNIGSLGNFHPGIYFIRLIVHNQSEVHAYKLIKAS
jgi:subtilisin family serine protease